MTVKVERIDACRWRIPREGAMRTEGLVFASTALMKQLVITSYSIHYTKLYDSSGLCEYPQLSDLSAQA